MLFVYLVLDGIVSLKDCGWLLSTIGAIVVVYTDRNMWISITNIN